MSDTIVDILKKFSHALHNLQEEMTAGFMKGATASVSKALLGVIAGEAVTSCADEMEKLKLWAASLPSDDARIPSTLETIKFGDAIIAGSISA